MDRVRAAALVGLVALLPGCFWIFRPDVAFNGENPFEDFRVVAIAPVFDMTVDRDLLDTDDGYSPLRLGELMSSEMIQFDGFEVIRSSVVAAALRDASGWHPNDPEGPTVARQVADALGADLIVTSAVTEFDPYTPRVAVSVQVFGSQRARGRGPDVGRLLQAGRPFDLETARRQGLLIAFEAMYDANQRWVQAELGAYANYRNDVDEHGLDPAKVYSWDAENYFRFVFNRILNRVVDDGAALQEAWDHGVDE